MSVAAEIFRRHSRPLEPIPTGVTQQLTALPGLRAVLLDVYGTMFVSGSGELTTGDDVQAAAALAAACQACGWSAPPSAAEGLALLRETIQRHHRRERGRGLEYPEVDIVQVWQEWTQQAALRGWLNAQATAADAARLAVEYEVRANPAWPMPDLQATLARLRAAGVMLGIISNAQFFTAEMFVGLLGAPPEELGFDPDLQFYSYHYRRAKPDPFLYELAAKALAGRGVAAWQTLYVGNDMLNDIRPAAGVGFRTALFAGDRRSLRRREGDPRVAGVRPELVVTSLAALMNGE